MNMKGTDCSVSDLFKITANKDKKHAVSQSDKEHVGQAPTFT